MTTPFGAIAAALGGFSEGREEKRQRARQAALDKERKEETALARAARQFQIDAPVRQREREGQLASLIERLQGGDESAYSELAAVAPNHAIVRQRAERDYAPQKPSGGEGPTHLPENSLIPDGQGGWKRAAGPKVEKAVKYEERPEQGGVAIYEDGQFKTWKTRPASERGSDASMTRTLQREGTLRGDFQADPTVKNSYGIANAAAQIRAAAAQTPNPQNDLDIIYQVVKLRDPGSVVREGEIDLQRTARSLPTYVAQAWAKVKNGQMLTAQERLDIVNLVNVKTGAALQQIQPIQKAFGAQARRFGADSSFVAPTPEGLVGGSGGLDLDALIRSNRPKKPGG